MTIAMLLLLLLAGHHPNKASSGFKAQRGQDIPLRRLGRPRAIAYTAVFLASALSSFATGAAVPVEVGYNQI
jgi:NAD(P)-dependent dehydrogenase (short-subunit alcohol dehydrogenase family)